MGDVRSRASVTDEEAQDACGPVDISCDSAQGSPSTPMALNPQQNRYIIDPGRLGHGAYGTVHGAVDTVTDRRVAIKCITNDADNAQDLRMLLREIRFLRSLPHANILQLTDIVAPTPLAVDSCRLVTPVFDTTLHWVIKNQPLSPLHRRHILVSMCRGLKYMHQANVVHRDIKPANVLLNADMSCVLCDLGFSRHLPNGGASRPNSRGGGSDSPGETAEFSSYVVTRWYRAPELLCGRRSYGAAVDSWSVGCVAAEMARGGPSAALLPGKNAKDQITRVVQLLGAPAEDALSSVCPDPHTAQYIRSIPQLPELIPSGSSAYERLRKACPRAEGAAELDLLARLLAFDPAKRLLPSDALQHAFLYEMHHHMREPDKPPTPPPAQTMRDEMAFDESDDALSLSYLRALIAAEVRRYHPRWRAPDEAPHHPAATWPPSSRHGKVRSRSWTEIE